MRIRQLEHMRLRVFESETSGVARPEASSVRTSAEHRAGEQFAIISAELDEDFAELAGVRAETLGVIRKIHDHTLAALLLAYYLNGLSWAAAARDMQYAAGYLRGEMHRRALDAAWSVMREIGADEKVLTQPDIDL